LPSLRHRTKPILVLVAIAVFALVLSACAVYKLGSLQLSQPGGIGSVRVHFEICTEPEGETPTCTPSEVKGEFQAIVGIAVPKGSTAPATITAVAKDGGPPIVFTRNDQAAQSIAEASAGAEEPWPPAGHDGIGYLSAPYSEEEGVLREWTVDADFGLPAAADGGSFAGPFTTTTAYGLRVVGGEGFSPDRPVDCFNPASGEKPEETMAFCEAADKGSVGVSDLKIGAPATTKVFVGGRASVTFPFDFASTSATLPSFALSGSTNLAKATVKVSAPTYAPTAVAPGTNRAADSSTVTVTVPKKVKAGTYDVTLTATTPQGVTVSQVAKLSVAKPKIKLGKVKLNKAKGTAILFVKVPSAGTATVAGKQVARAKRKSKATGAKTLKLPVKPKGKAKLLLAETGSAKLKAKVTYKPSSGAPVTRSKAITLKKAG
jgi:methionine-rich copper-binding protein CopC